MSDKYIHTTPEPFVLSSRMRALSIKQPYAQLILPPALKVETRTWYTPYRGWVLICSSQMHYRPWEIVQISGERQLSRMDPHLVEWKDMHRSKDSSALAIAWLAQCRPMTVSDEDLCYVQHKPGLYCHIFESVHTIIPFGWSGRIGYNDVTDYDKGRIIISSHYNNIPL